MNGCASGLALIERLKAIRKWDIKYGDRKRKSVFVTDATGKARQSASTVRKVSFLPERSTISSSDSSSSSKSSKSLGPMSSSSSSSSNISCRSTSVFLCCCFGILNLKPVSIARCSKDVKPPLSTASLMSSVDSREAALSRTGHLEIQ